MGVGMCLYAQLMQTKKINMQACNSGSGSVSGNVLQRMLCHMVVTMNSDGGMCNAEAVHKWTQTGTSAVKQFVQYVHMSWWCYWSDCRCSLNTSSTWPPLAPLGGVPERDGSWKEGVLVGIYRRLKMLELLGMTSSCRLVPWNWMVLPR